MAMSGKRTTEKNHWVHNFDVSHPVCHKKGFTVYKVISTVFPKPYPEGATKLTVWKRFNDFKKLYKELSLIHKQLYLSGEFPKFPRAKVFGRFDDEVIEERKKSALALLNFSATHPQLYTSKVFVTFFEAGYQIEDLNGDVGPSLTEADSFEKLNDNCLIPERIWETPKETSNEVDQTADHVSVNSVASSTPDTPTFTDSDSILSGSILSLTSDTFVNPTLPSSTSDYVLTSKSTSASSLMMKKSKQAPTSESETLLTPSAGEYPNSRTLNTADEFDSNLNFSLVANSASCSSLNSLPISKTSSSNTNSLTRMKKSNGFGFFDFLPIFPKKLQQTKQCEEKHLADSLTASYICEAAGHFAVAQQHESNSEYGSAFNAYKEGIAVLLAGAQSDEDLKRRALVRNKLDKYLMRAESIHAEHLSSEVRLGDPQDTIFPPSIDLPSLDKLKSSCCPKDASDSSLPPSNVIELKKYKVVGCLPNRVLIVVNMMKDKPKCFAIKVVTKSSCPVDPEKPTIMPTQIPFLVNLIKWFDTENSIVLLMPYVGGRKLIDFVKTYQTKQIAVISHECSPTVEDCAFEPSFPKSAAAIESHDALSVLSAAAISTLAENYNCGLDLSNLNNPENYNTQLFDELSIKTQEISSIGEELGLTIERKNKEVISSKCFNGEGVLQDERESESKEKAGESNLENKSESRPGSKSETKECDACPSLPYVCETKTEIGDGDDDIDVKTFSHYEPSLKLPTKSDAFNRSTPKVGNFSQFHNEAVSKYVCDGDESRDNSSSLRQSNSMSTENQDFLVDTHELIASSKDLIQTVSNTLAQGRVAHRTAITPFDHLTENTEDSDITQPSVATNSSTNYPSSGINQEAEKEFPPCYDVSNSMLPDSINNNNVIETEDSFFVINKNSDEYELLVSDDACNASRCQLDSDVHLSEEEQYLYGDASSSASKGDKHKKLRRRYKRQSKSEERSVDTQENDTDGLAALKRMVPECCIKVWAAEMILALEKLHALGLTYGDLDMRNILLGENGHILLSYTCILSEVDQVPQWSEFLAPEARTSFKKSLWNLHSSADWWSLGAILFLLLTGETVERYHLEGFHAQTVLTIPDKNVCGDHVSPSAKTLLTELLNFTPELRLGYYGAEEIKSHPFFEGFDWDAALDSCNN